MNRRQAMKASVAAATGVTLASVASAQSNDDQSQASLDTVVALRVPREAVTWPQWQI